MHAHLSGFRPITLSEQQMIIVDIAAYNAMQLWCDNAKEKEIREIEMEQPEELRPYFRKRFKYWLSLYTEPLFFLSED